MIGKTNAISGVSAPVPRINTVSGSVISISDALALPAESLTIEILTQQSGSGDPSPDNIRPISGHSAVDVFHRGKNLWSADASFEKDGSATYTPKTIDSLPAGTYTISGLFTTQDANNLVRFSFRTTSPVNVSLVANSGSRTSATFTLTEPCTTIRCYGQDNTTGRNSATFTNVMVELGSTETAYEPFTGNTYTIQLGQTVYGGSLNVTTGVLTKVPYYNPYNGEALVGPWVSSMDKYVSGNTPTTGAQVVDLGGTGTEVQLTSTTVQMLLGNNTMWSDSGDSELQYWSRR